MKINKIVKPSEMIKIEMTDDLGIFVGRASLFLIFNDLHKEPYGLLEDVFVEEKFRGQGYGTKLVQEILSLAKEKKCYKIIAQSRHTNTKVHELYKRLGFKEHGLNFRLDF